MIFARFQGSGWRFPGPQTLPRPLEEIGARPHHEGPLDLLAGPERIESGWWDGGDIARDYFIARTQNEALVWIYRERGGGGWYLHGLFA